MVRTRFFKRDKMVRGKNRNPYLRRYSKTPGRKELINHIILLYPYWEKNIHYMSDTFLLRHVDSDLRDYFNELLKKEKRNDRQRFIKVNKRNRR